MIPAKEVYWSQENNSDLSYVPGVDLEKKKMKPGFQKRHDNKLKKSTKQSPRGVDHKSSTDDSVKDKRGGKSRASPKAFRVSLKDLCPEDKLRVANLIRELAKAGEEKEASENKLVKERHKFNTQLEELKADKVRIEQEQQDILAQFKECQNLLVLYQKQIAEEQNRVAQDINRLLTETPLNRSQKECCEKKIQMPDELDHDITVREMEDNFNPTNQDGSNHTKASYYSSNGKFDENYRPSQSIQVPSVDTDHKYTSSSQHSNFLPSYKPPSHVDVASEPLPQASDDLRQSRFGGGINFYDSEPGYDRSTVGGFRNTTVDGLRGTASAFDQRSKSMSPQGQRLALMVQKRQLEAEQAQLQQMLTEQENILKFRQSELKKRHDDYLRRMTHFQKYGEVPDSSDDVADNPPNLDDPKALRDKLSRISSTTQRLSKSYDQSDEQEGENQDQLNQADKSYLEVPYDFRKTVNLQRSINKPRPYSEHSIRLKRCNNCKWTGNDTNDTAGTELASLRNTLDELTLRSQLLSAAASNLIDSSDADISCGPSRDRSDASHLSQPPAEYRDSDTDDRRSAYTTGLTSDPSSVRCTKAIRTRALKKSQSHPSGNRSTKRFYPSDTFSDQHDINPLEKEVSSTMFSTPSRRLHSTMNNISSLHALASDMDNLPSATNVDQSDFQNTTHSSVNPRNVQSAGILRGPHSYFDNSSSYQGMPSNLHPSTTEKYNRLSSGSGLASRYRPTTKFPRSKANQRQQDYENPNMHRGIHFDSQNLRSYGPNFEPLDTPGMIRQTHSTFEESSLPPNRQSGTQNSRLLSKNDQSNLEGQFSSQDDLQHSTANQGQQDYENPNMRRGSHFDPQNLRSYGPNFEPLDTPGMIRQTHSTFEESPNNLPPNRQSGAQNSRLPSKNDQSNLEGQFSSQDNFQHSTANQGQQDYENPNMRRGSHFDPQNLRSYGPNFEPLDTPGMIRQTHSTFEESSLPQNRQSGTQNSRPTRGSDQSNFDNSVAFQGKPSEIQNSRPTRGSEWSNFDNSFAFQGKPSEIQNSRPTRGSEWSNFDNSFAFQGKPSEIQNSRPTRGSDHSNFDNSVAFQGKPSEIQNSRPTRGSEWSNFDNSFAFQGKPSEIQNSRPTRGSDHSNFDNSVAFQGKPSEIQNSRPTRGSEWSNFDNSFAFQGKPSEIQNSRPTRGSEWSNFDNSVAFQGKPSEIQNSRPTRGSDHTNFDSSQNRPTVLQSSRWERENHSGFEHPRPSVVHGMNPSVFQGSSPFQDRPSDFHNSRSLQNDHPLNEHNDPAFDNQNSSFQDRRHSFRDSRLKQTSFEDPNLYEDVSSRRRSFRFNGNHQTSFDEGSPYPGGAPPVPPNSRYNSENQITTDESARNVTFDPEDSELLEDIFFIK